MPLHLAKVALAVEKGLSVVCATCSHYWEAQDNGKPGMLCNTPGPCGSVLANNDFPHYDGPMLGNLDRWCFMCGQPATFTVGVDGKRSLGICTEHLPRLKVIVHRANIEVRGGVDAAESILNPVPKKSLAAAIHEVESYYAKKEGREP